MFSGSGLKVEYSVLFNEVQVSKSNILVGAGFPPTAFVLSAFPSVVLVITAATCIFIELAKLALIELA